MDSSTNRVRRARREAVLEGEGENRKRRIRSQSRRGMGRSRKFLSFRAGFRILLAVIASREWTQVWRKLKKDTILEHDAAQYRDELKAISPHSLLKCSSDITTVGTRVQVRSVYIEGRNQPSKGQYFFAYRIRITNNSDRPVQLLWRHWIITDGNGKSENFWGIGVIGEQPVLLPKTGFEYSSACPLSTPSGRMEGEYEMKYIDKAGSDKFNVEIAPFALSTLDDTDIF